MFIRFVIHSNDPDSGRRQGLFQALANLEHQGLLIGHDQESYHEISDWFRKNLRKPRSFARSSKPNAKNVALSWFKDSVIHHIRKMHGLAQILIAHLPHGTCRRKRSGASGRKFGSDLPAPVELMEEERDRIHAGFDERDGPGYPPIACQQVGHDERDTEVQKGETQGLVSVASHGVSFGLTLSPNENHSHLGLLSQP
jgi:hypothetical protein